MARKPRSEKFQKNKISLVKRRKLFHRISLPISGFKHIFTAYTLAIFQRILLTAIIPTYKKIKNPASTLLKIRELVSKFQQLLLPIFKNPKNSGTRPNFTIYGRYFFGLSSQLISIIFIKSGQVRINFVSVKSD